MLNKNQPADAWIIKHLRHDLNAGNSNIPLPHEKGLNLSRHETNPDEKSRPAFTQPPL
jgi:hypothetical protein